MQYLEAPNPVPPTVRRSLFVAGGITGTEDWQEPFIGLLESTDLFVMNPRRKNFPMGDEDAGMEQIRWEYRALAMASGVSFWFPPETLCPITLFELGTFMKNDRPLFVGCHPDYARSFDVKIQLSLYRPEVKLVYSIGDLAEQVKKWAL